MHAITWLMQCPFYLWWFLAATFGCNWLRIMPQIVSNLCVLKLLCCFVGIWADIPIWDSGPNPNLGQRDIPIFGTVLSLTQRPTNDQKIEVEVFSIITNYHQQLEVLSISTNSLENFISHATKSVFNDYCLISAWNLQTINTFLTLDLQTIKTFLTLELSQYRTARNAALFPKRAECCMQRQQQTWKHPVLASQTCPSCAWVLPQELSHWLCTQILQSSSGITYRNDCQMTGRCSYLDSNLNSAAWPTICKVFICTEIPQ